MGKITEEMVEKVPELSAKDLVPDANALTKAAIDSTLSWQWWRGYYAGKTDWKEDDR